MNRLLFLYFLQGKGWLDGKPDYLHSRFQECWQADPDGHSFSSQVLDPLFHSLSDPNAQSDSVGAVPYLGHSLFDEGYGQPNCEFLPVTNSTFRILFDDLLKRFHFNTGEEVGFDPLVADPLKTRLAETGVGAGLKPAPTAEREPYTPIPDFSKIAIDPEILGRVFESLMLQDGKVSKENLRKPTGSYYTPRPIVRFMCREALTEFLVQKIAGNGTTSAEKAREQMEALAGGQGDLFTRSEARILKDSLLSCRVCDPAVGSGAFAIGMLEEMFLAIARLDLILNGPESLSRRNYAYDLKKRVVESCLHGADIQQPALRICEARLWLALAAEFQLDPDKPFAEALREVPPFPNLSHRFVCGNSLLDSAELFAGKASFDILIANPPYRARISGADWGRVCSLFPNARSAKNSAAAFLALPRVIGSDKVIACQIVPKSLTYSQGWAKTRSILEEEFHLLSTVDVSQSFPGVLLEEEIVVYSRKPISHSRWGSRSLSDQTTASSPVPSTLNPQPSTLSASPSTLSEIGHKLLQRLSKENPILGNFVTVKRGKGWQRRLTKIPTANAVPVLRGADIRQFRLNSDLPLIRVDSGLHQTLAEMRQPKLVCQNILAHVRRPYDTLVVMCAFDRRGYAALDTVNLIFPKPDCPYSLDFLCGLLNSSFARWFFYFAVYNRAIRTMHFDSPYVGRLPLAKGQSRQVGQVEAAVQQLMDSDLQKKYYLHGDGESYDRLDELVCDLFELDSKERSEVLRLSPIQSSQAPALALG